MWIFISIQQTVSRWWRRNEYFRPSPLELFVHFQNSFGAEIIWQEEETTKADETEG